MERTVRMNNGKFLALGILLVVSMGARADESACDASTCPAGTKAVTYATKSEPYYACPTRELESYVSMVQGFIAIGAQLGSMPNISDKTGDPEFKGESQQMIDQARTEAKVATYDEAVAACRPGKAGKSVIIMNLQVGSLVAWVVERKTNASYWVPLSALNKTAR